MLENVNIGNVLNRVVNDARHNLFYQGELAQLTFGAFDVAAKNVREGQDEIIMVHFPVGYKADKQTVHGMREYARADLIRQYEFLALHILPLNGLVQLVTILEALLRSL